MSKEYIIYADESDKKGRYFSNFYGGVLLRSNHIEQVRMQLQSAKEAQNLFHEIKWSKVTGQYLHKYQSVMDVFFNLVAKDQIKVRIMFTQNARIPPSLTHYQQEHAYHLLYYQFIKHAFGLQYCANPISPVFLRLLIDNMPHSREKNEQFAGYLLGLQDSPEFRRQGIQIRRSDINEVDSHAHVPLQYLDIVLGAMQFRLNDKHKDKPNGAWRRGNRTRAKERLYKHIHTRIREIYPGFNIGVSTGIQGDISNRWHHPYRHWLFKPKAHRMDSEQTKKK